MRDPRCMFGFHRFRLDRPATAREVFRLMLAVPFGGAPAEIPGNLICVRCGKTLPLKPEK